MYYSITTLGCKVNQYESDAVALSLEKAGYEKGVPADVCCVNTCAVTEESARKSRQAMRHARKLNPLAVIVLMGCLPQITSDPESAFPEADIVIGNRYKSSIPEFIELFRKTGEKIIRVEDISTGGEFERMHVDRGERTRAVMKIEDGCNNFCSYCVIPYARGRVRSRDFSDILPEAMDLCRNGYKEIVLTGIHLDSYKDGDRNLTDVIELLNGIDSLERIRLGSLEPVFITDGNVSRMKQYEKLCPHFHLSLQSGCDRTLKAMNRHYSTQEFRDSLKRLRIAFPGCSITTDIIVGFPGESESDFRESLAFAEEMAFSKIHVFPYSIRKGTVAARMSDQISNEVKSSRASEMILLSDKMQYEFGNTMIGNTYPVLFERNNKGFAPNYVEVRSEKGVPGEILNVKVLNNSGAYVEGEIV